MTSLLRASAESETRTLTWIGATLVLFVIISTGLYFVVNPPGRRSNSLISVAIETPYVGQGVADGAPVIMHGVKVGEVTSISSLSGGGVRLKVGLQPGPTTGLTDSMGIDFRPSNYFGVTGINLIAGQSGRPLHNGAEINLIPKGNFTLQALLYRLGELSNNVINQRLVHVVDRVTRYTDALNPLLETILIVGTSITNVQTVSTQQLLRNTTGISAATPGFVDALANTVDTFLHSYVGPTFSRAEADKDHPYLPLYYDVNNEDLLKAYNSNTKLLQSNPDRFMDSVALPLLYEVAYGIFGALGTLLGSHANDLIPATEELRVLADVVPKLVSPERIADTARELRSRLERMYAGSGDQRALQVRIVLDSLPGVAAPVDLMIGGRH